MAPKKRQMKLSDTWGAPSKTKPAPLHSNSKRRNFEEDSDVELVQSSDEDRSVMSEGEVQPTLERQTTRISPPSRRRATPSSSSSSGSPPPSSSPRKRLISRSQRIKENRKHEKEPLEDERTEEEAGPASKPNTQARIDWEGEGKVVREEKISMRLDNLSDGSPEISGVLEMDSFVVPDDEEKDEEAAVVSTSNKQQPPSTSCRQPVASSSRFPSKSSAPPKERAPPSPPPSASHSFFEDDFLRLSPSAAPFESPASHRAKVYGRKKPTPTTRLSARKAAAAARSLPLAFALSPTPPPSRRQSSTNSKPKPAASSRSQLAPPTSDGMSGSDLPSMDEAIRQAAKPTASSRAKGKGREVVRSPPVPPRTTTRKRKVAAISEEEEEEVKDSESDASLVVEPPKKGRTLTRRRSRPAVEATSEEDEEEVPPSRSRKGNARAEPAVKKNGRMVEDSDEEEPSGEESSDTPRATTRRRLSRRRSRPEEGEVDVGEDLGDADGRTAKPTGSRLRVNPTQSSGSKAKQSAMEKLKLSRIRKGSNSSPTVQVIEDTEEGSENEVVEEDPWNEDDDDASDACSEDSFIVMDDEEAVELPAEFQQVQPMEQQFNIVVSYHICLISQGPSWLRNSGNSDYFVQPLRRVRRHIRDLMSQKVRSSVWQKHLVNALERWPHWDSEYLEDLPPCDACRITNRVATRHVALAGSRYDPETFETLVPDDTDEDSHMSEEKEEDREFNFGKYCCAKAHLYHRMAHWEYDLHEFLKHHITRLSEDSDGDNDDDAPPRKFVPFEVVADPSRPSRTDANGIIEFFDGKGFMAQEYHKFQELEEAQADMYKKGEEDD